MSAAPVVRWRVPKAAIGGRRAFASSRRNFGQPPRALRLPHPGRGGVRTCATKLPDCEGYYRPPRACSPRARPFMQFCADSRHIPNVDMDRIYTGNGVVSELINPVHAGAARTRGDEIFDSQPGLPAVGPRAPRSSGGDARALQLRTREAEWFTGTLKDIESKISPAHQGHRHHQPQQPHGRPVPARGASRAFVVIARKHQLDDPVR